MSFDIDRVEGAKSYTIVVTSCEDAGDYSVEYVVADSMDAAKNLARTVRIKSDADALDMDVDEMPEDDYMVLAVFEGRVADLNIGN